MAALRGKTTKCAVPTLFCGDVLIVESNYDITNIHEWIFEKLLASVVIEVFLVKAHHQNTIFWQYPENRSEF